MSTHTSGNKLKPITYSVNKHYSGPTYETVLQSLQLRNEGLPNLLQFEYLKEIVLNSKTKFAKMFFEQLKRMRHRIDENWVDACKSREKDLMKVLEVILLTDDYTDLVLVVKDNKGEVKESMVRDLDNIKWCPKRFSIFRLNDEEILDVFTNSGQPKFYSTLFKSMFLVAKCCKEARAEDLDLFEGLKQLALSIIEIARLYNETNPDNYRWFKQEMDTYRILTDGSVRQPNEEMETLFAEVCGDIVEGRLPYIQVISRAIRSRRKYLNSSFNDEDYYYSFKSDPAVIMDFKYKQSLIKSMVEIDPLDGHPFDEFTGYKSHYNKVAPDGYYAPWICTIHIPNPGKYKTRAIHLALSSIQDRCCYIHNRIKSVLDSMETDCTRDQDKGRDFARMISSPFYREKRNYNSVLAFDWSNATDKMDQSFQEACLRLLFDKPIVDFWHEISSCEKEFRFKSGERVTYTQSCGQPQGLLGSFDAFSFAHHIIMLMTMKKSGLELEDSREFYRVLGDDSIISSINYDPANKVGDNYCSICAWANMEINRSKSTEILSNDMIAMVDFAKVTVLNGEYFSPIPTRIANRMGDKDGDYYALTAAIWLSLYGPCQKDWILSLLDKYYPDSVDNYIAKIAVKSGVLPAFKRAGFNDEELLNNSDTLRIALLYAIQKIKSSLLSGLLPDNIKENLNMVNEKEQTDALLSLIPEDLSEVWDKVEDDNHKVNIAIESNLYKEDIIKSLLSSSDDQAKILAASLRITDEEIDLMLEALDLVKMINVYNVDIIEYQDRILNLVNDLKVLERLNYRSLYKKNSVDVMVLRRTICSFRDMFTERVTQIQQLFAG